MELKLAPKNKKGIGIVSGIIAGIGGLVVLTIVTLLIVDTLLGADLLSKVNPGPSLHNTSASYNVTQQMIMNLTAGIDNVSAKLPTILLIAAVVLLFGAIVILVARSRQMTGDSGSI